MGRSKFIDETQVTPDPDVAGRFRAEVTAGWNAPVIPQGGIVAALGLRAAAAELATPEQRLRSVTTVFAAQVPAGPVVIDVGVLRRGRSMSQVTATVRSEDAGAGHTLIAVFGVERPGFEFTALRRADAPGPDECTSFRDGPDDSDWDKRFDATFWDQIEGRFAIGRPWWDDEPVARRSAEKAYWYRFEELPLRDDGTYDPLALVVLADTMPGSVGERVGPRDVLWLSPSADLTVHILGEATSEWIFAHGRARHAAHGYASVDMELWCPEQGLVAYGTQVMFMSFPDGPPDPAALRLDSPG